MKKFEFILYINGNIICQRYFSVKGFNKKSLKSLEIVDAVRDCCDLVKDSLKDKCVDYLWKMYNPYETQNEEDITGVSIYEKEDIFEFEFRVDDKSVVKQAFTGNVYPQKVRYSVDVRELVPGIINTLQQALCLENFTVE